MMMRRTLVSAALLLGLNTAAHADVLATGAIFGGPTQNLAICYLYNAGTSAVTITNNQIIRQNFGPVVPLGFDNCGTLSAGGICAIYAAAVNTAAHACKFVITESASEVRGVLEIRSGGTVLNSSDLR
jgi:hypothetical protein